MAKTVEDRDMVKLIDSAEDVKNKFKWEWLGCDVSHDGQTYKLQDCIKKADVPGKAMCHWCNVLMNYGARGRIALVEHTKTAKHKKQVQTRKTNYTLGSFAFSVKSNGPGPSTSSLSIQPVTPTVKPLLPFADRSYHQQATVLGFLAEHSLPLSMAPRLIDLSKELNQDVKSLSKLSMDRTAASYKMRYGLAKSFHQQTVENLRSTPFSLNIDECTSTTHKRVLAVLVSYFSPQLNKVVVEHLDSVEVTVVKSESLYNVLVNMFTKYDIPWTNLMALLMDSCNVMRGSKSGLEVRIRENLCPHLLDIDGDSCHHIHNCCKTFCKPFGYWVEGLFTDLHNDTKWSSDIRELMAEISEIMGLKYCSPEQFVNHRWLSCYDVCLSNLRMMDVYYIFYYSFMNNSDRPLYQAVMVSMLRNKNISEEARNRIREIQQGLGKKSLTVDGRKRKDRILEKVIVMRRKTSLVMNFYVSVLPLLKRYVCVFQTTQPMIQKLHDEQIQVFTDFLACFIDPHCIADKSAKQLKELDINKNIVLPTNQFFLGKPAEDIIRQCHKDDKTTKDFRQQVLDAYLNCAIHMQKKLPLNNLLLSSLSAIDPSSRGFKESTKCLKRLSQLVQNVLSEEEQVTYHAEVYQFQVDRNLPEYTPGSRIDEWWGSVSVSEHYPALTKLAKSVISIFHGPMVESSFNVMGDIVKAKSSRINVTTYSAIQTVKYSLRARDSTSLEFFHRKDILRDYVSKPLLRNMRLAASEYKQELLSKQEKKEERKRQLQLKDQVLETKTKAKQLKEAADKVARLSHQRAQKRKMEERLKLLVKKRRISHH